VIDPGRYAYLPMPKRPPLKLPDGNRVAVWVAPNVEFYEQRPPASAYRDPWGRVPHPDVWSYAQRDWGNRRGVWRCFDLLDKYGIRGTVSLNVAVFDHFPEIAKAMVERKWDYMSHGIYNTRYSFGLSVDEERAQIADVIATVKKYTGKMISGWLGPALTTTLNTPDLLAEAGVKYWVDYFHDDQPFPLNVNSGRLISVPYSIEINDAGVISGQAQTGETFGRFVMDQFDRLYAEGEQSARIMCIALHPFLMHQLSRQKYLDQAFQHIYSHAGVWNTTGEEIADWYYANYYDQVATLTSEPVAVG
jgi:allantoinase